MSDILVREAAIEDCRDLKAKQATSQMPGIVLTAAMLSQGLQAIPALQLHPLYHAAHV